MSTHFYRWNRENNTEHWDHVGDNWKTGGDTFFHTRPNGVFEFCTYSTVEKEYKLKSRGVKLIDVKRKKEVLPSFEDEGETDHHQLEISFAIIELDGYVKLEIDQHVAKIEWSDGLIKDFHGNEARLHKIYNHPEDRHEVSEILSHDELNNFILMKRFERLRDMNMNYDRETRHLIFLNILELK